MRLGQLARQLKITSAQVITSIKEEFGITIESNPNIKLEEQHVDFVLEKYSPEVIIEEATEAKEVIPSPIENNVKEEIKEEEKAEEKEIVIDKIELPKEEPKTKITDFIKEFEESEVDPDAELIKAPKVEIEGFKIVDKIDLPQPKEKVEKELEEEEEKELTPEEIQRKEEYEERKAKREERKRIQAEKKAEYEARKKENQERRIKRQAEREERERIEERKKHYESKINTKKKATQPKKKKKVKIQQEEIIVEEKPKSLLGRIWKWFNT